MKDIGQLKTRFAYHGRRQKSEPKLTFKKTRESHGKMYKKNVILCSKNEFNRIS